MRKKWLYFLALTAAMLAAVKAELVAMAAPVVTVVLQVAVKVSLIILDGGSNPPGDGSGNPAGDGVAGEVPESYEFNLGEGLTITDEQKTAFTAIAKDAKLSQAQADSLLKMHSEIINGYMHEAEEAIEKNIAECQKQGTITKENLGFAKAAVDTFGGSEAMQVLIDTGAINHPAVCKLFVTIGQLISEDKPADTHVGGGKGTPRAEDILFPNSKY